VPGSHSLKAPHGELAPAPGLTPESDPIEASSINTDNIPKTPPKPEDLSTVAAHTLKPPTTVPTGTGTATVAPPAGPTSPPPKKKRRLRNFVLNLILLSTLGYGVGVYYALVSDNWHDFFTEYVPFGEDAVGYFEEREFKKRFPGHGAGTSRLHQQVRGENKVKIPSKAGVSSRPAEEKNPKSKSSDLATKGPHTSALEEKKAEPPVAAAPPAPKHEESSTTHKLLPKDESKPAPPKQAPVAVAVPPEPIKTEPPPPPPSTATLVDHINIENASEPVVQDVVKILNDLITVINSDGAAVKYATTIDSAKNNLKKVIGDISTLKATTQQEAEDKIKNLNTEFDNMAKELLRRQEAAVHDQEMRWKEEFELEQKNIKEAYDNRLKSELEQVNKVYDQKLKNELLEQQIALHKEFTSSVRDRVESERSGRLSKLGELSSTVSDLEKLTGDWNSVVDANLRTQHLLVAVEAVRATLENADRPRPFIEELAALKEVAADDAVVNAAIASIHPSAYQRGIPTSAQLIDRFRRVAAEVRKAALLPENAGVASHVASLVLSKVMFKKSGLPVGDDVESILTRTEVLLEEGNLDQAAREMNVLTGWSKTLSKDWLGECRKVLEVQQALDVSSNVS
jgi:mitofilin